MIVFVWGEICVSKREEKKRKEKKRKEKKRKEDGKPNLHE
jgi:hypothetical protein